MHYRVNVSFSYDLESEANHEEAIKMAEKDLSQRISDKLVTKRVVRVEKLVKEKHKIKLGEFTPEEVFSKISNEPTKIEFLVDDKKFYVKLNSPRYFVLQKNPACIACGLNGTTMFLEQHPADRAPHFNLYAIENGQLVMLTKDHIMPKSKGGPNIIDNYVTLCSICNNIKANFEISYQQVATLRKLYNDNKHMNKKELASFIRHNRNQMIYLP